MPPFVVTDCAHCRKPNRFDLAELKRKDTIIEKKHYRHAGEKDRQEFSVTCIHCGRKFKITVEAGKHG